MFKKIILIFSFLILIVAGCTNNQGTTKDVNTNKQPIKIGFIAPLSGDVANYGLTEKNAVDLAVEEINGQGGVSGSDLLIVYEDGRCNGKDAASAAQKLIGIDKVKIILGGFCSSETLAIAPITEKHKIVLSTAFSSNPQISGAGEYIFRSCPKDTDWAPFAAKTMIQAEHKQLALITEKNDFTFSSAQLIKDYFLNHGGTIMVDEYFNEGIEDYKTVLTKIKQSEANVVFLNAISNKTGGIMARQIREMNIKLPVYSDYVLGSDEALKIAGEAAENIILFDAAELPIKQKSQLFLQKYKQKFGEPAHEFLAALRYDSVYIIRDALFECGENTDCIKDYLYNLKEYDGTAGTYGFDENGDVVGIGFVVKQIRDGKAVLAD